MRTQNLSAVFQVMFTILLCGICTGAAAQKNIIWKGGAPGHETDWHYAKNWSTHSVPNEFSNVIIPDVSTTTRTLPVIRAGVVEVNSLTIAPNVTLSLGETVQLTVLENSDSMMIANLRRSGSLISFVATARKN